MASNRERLERSTPLVLVGAGGFGREVHDIVVAINRDGAEFDLLGYVDDSPGEHPLVLRLGELFLGNTDELVRRQAGFAIGIGSGEVRRTLDAKLVAAGCMPVTLIHPIATVGTDNHIGKGCILAAGARVTTNITLGRHVDLHVNSTVGHDSILDDFASVYPGATVSGNVHLGEAVTIGTGANVLPGVTIGAGAFVGAGAVVISDVPPGVTVAGVPAKPLRMARSVPDPTRDRKEPQ